MVEGQDKGDPMALKHHEEEVTLVELKLTKSKCKAAFTRARNKLINLIDEEDSSKELLSETLDKLEVAMDKAIEIITEVINFYKENKKTKEMKQSMDEITVIETQYEETVTLYNSMKCDTNSEVNDTSHREQTSVNSDMYKQLKRVSIPVFTGKTKEYEFWNSAFTACIDKTDSTPEYKFLQLRQYLGGEALKCVEGLGHTEAAYEAAKERLERKYGGKRRKINRFIEEIDRFPVMRNENPKLIEKYADLLDITIINLEESDSSDLNSQFMYLQLLKKLPESMITRYQRWLHQNEKLESVKVLKTWVVREAEFNSIALETRYGLDTKGERHENTKQRSYFSKEQNNGNKCNICGGIHKVWDCHSFKMLDVTSRWEKAKENNLCFRCLRDNHKGSECKRFMKCGINGCTKVHNRLLHKNIVSNKSARHLNENAPVFTPGAVAEPQHQAFYSARSQIALRTVPIILTANGKKIKVNALLDDGSTKTYVNQDLAEELGVKGKSEKVKVNLLNGKTETFETMSVKLGLESVHGHTKLDIDAFVVEDVTGSLSMIDWNRHSSKWDHLSGIQFPVINKKNTVDVLIGLDYANLHSSIHEIHGKQGEPIARLTPLGWTCVGELEKDEQTNLFSTYFINEQDDLNQVLKGFWEIDSYGTKNCDISLSQKEQTVLNNTKQSMVCNEGQYEVKIPWKSPPNLPDNYKMAMKRLENTEKRLKKEKFVESQYKQTIDKYVEKGYLRKVLPEEEKPPYKWYLPHFPVVRLGRETTKVRIVFDAAAKCEGVCLNDYIDPGPKLQNELFDVLLRFRKHEIAIVSDISEMYLRVGISEPDRRFHRILWDKEEYEFTRLVFGVNASPFLAQLVSQNNAKHHADMYPAAAETILKSTYMDDSMDSVCSEKEGIELYQQLSNLWQKAGMYARKWMSNSVKVLEQVPAEDRASEVNLETGYLPNTKTLGVIWKADKDIFTFNWSKTSQQQKVTKRNLLKTVASLFDPLGFISPYVVTGKILMQKLWLSNYNWDDEIETNLVTEIERWKNELPYLNNVRVPRCLLFTKKSNSVLHTFVDASEDAYGAAVYVRHESLDDQSVTVKLVCGKTRVAPLSFTSIPRLELMAAVIGLRLAIMVGRTLGVATNKMMFWSDSANVLYWISGQSRRYKPFIANRIGEIHEKSTPSQWRHVPSKENPADIASRGLSAESLVDCSLWWKGPGFLEKEEESWPKNITEIGPEHTENKEIRKKYIETESYLVIGDDSQLDDRLDPNRYSDWFKLVRVMAWVNRFIVNARSKVVIKKENELSVEELNNAESRFIRRAQKESYPEEYATLCKGKTLPANSKLSSLNLKLDDDGLMRCDTRLKFGKFLPYDTKFPIVLPRKSRVTKLIVKQHHELGDHYGTNQTLASLSTKYWLISGREEIREWERECTRCKRFKARAGNQIMAPLPPVRLEKTLRAFAYCSVDFGGPFLTKQGRGKPRQKRYLCLFTCMSSRAIHLEMAVGLDTDSFLNAFYRMASRRGMPDTMYSDNGTNFIGAYRELKELYDKIDKDKLTKSTAKRGVNWHFNPPAAPHFGGVHETMIKSAKRAVYAVLKGADVTDEELLTAFIGVEGLLNSRPLSYQSSSPDDNSVLTPNHFLHGQMGGEFAPESVDTTVFDVKRRWRRVQEIVKHFWKRWMQEFLPFLGGRKKWFQEQRDFAVGDIILVVDPDQPRGKWLLGRVINTYQGNDGHVRVVSVRVGNTILKRPVTRLCLIEKCDH